MADFAANAMLSPLCSTHNLPRNGLDGRVPLNRGQAEPLSVVALIECDDAHGRFAGVVEHLPALASNLGLHLPEPQRLGLDKLAHHVERIGRQCTLHVWL
eukprot:CAMPEP_0119421280 /NCGR_PEP_ID=MMETSP1335-20130426/25546_1 /TAXON_ID=259385 /ORGANISM="Chrysoculter rhomboideus, Strain RCC1486" /LENGTH=99 /DNA_ID=CAMNT_0007446687 /DNA_START=196 /DNA_END=492 /DNA_ORIENTATION=-